MAFAKGSAKASVYQALYERRRVSKQMLCEGLGLSLPTVSAALKALVQEGLIEKAGTYASTGGRPAAIYELRTDTRVALGAELVADRLRLAAVDLYGTVLAQVEKPIAFERSEAYLDEISRQIAGMAGAIQDRGSTLVGITIAIQGIVSEGQRVTFGGLLGRGGIEVSVDDFANRLPYMTRLVHDAEAAAYAELWRHRELSDFVYLSLNDHLGSALVVEGKLLQGGPLGAGVAEHMTLHPNGRPCYCGNLGCAETTLGALALEHDAGMPLDDLMDGVRSGVTTCALLWDHYLDDLALLIHNVRMVACCDVIVGGRLGLYLREADLRILKTKVAAHGVLSRTDCRLTRGHYGNQATVIGAALLPIDEFLASAQRLA